MFLHLLYFRSRNCSLLISNKGEQRKCNRCQDLLEYLGQKDDDLDNFDNNVKDVKKEDRDDYNMNEDEHQVEVKPKVISFSLNGTSEIKSEKKHIGVVCPYCNVYISSAIQTHVKMQHREKLEHYGENYAKQKKRFKRKYGKYFMSEKNISKLEIEDGTKPSRRWKPTNCMYCEMTLANLTSLHLHVKSLHEEKIEEFLEQNKSRVKRCPYCKVVYLNKDSMVGHVRKVHREHLKDYAENHARKTKIILGIKGDFKCPYCPQTFSAKHQLIWRHVVYNHKDLAEDYAQNYEPERKYLCPSEGCIERFCKEKRMVTHAFEKHGITITPDVPDTKPYIVCPFCNEKFTSSQRIPNHLEAHHAHESENSVYIEFYNQHQKTEVCQECGKVFKNLSSFQFHMRESHSDLHAEKCEICGKRYQSKESLKIHMKTHEECESLCIECGKTYSNRHKLRIHINNHHSNKSFTCQECFKTYKTRAKLATHVRALHLNERLYPCKMCDKAFRDRHCITEHVTAIHLKIKPYFCEYCNFQTAKIHNLNLHRRKSHEAKNITRLEFLAFVEGGKHPYYDQEKRDVLKSVVHKQIIDFKS